MPLAAPPPRSRSAMTPPTCAAANAIARSLQQARKGARGCMSQPACCPLSVLTCRSPTPLQAGGRKPTDKRRLVLIQGLAQGAGNQGLHVDLIWASAFELRALVLQQVIQAAMKSAKAKARDANQRFVPPKFSNKMLIVQSLPMSTRCVSAEIPHRGCFCRHLTL
eukprot:4022492-Pleurochrysis_carterae.AAC.2